MDNPNRREALRALCERHWLPINPDGPWPTTAQEDIAAYFGDEPREIKRYAAVTCHEDVFYVYPDFDEYAEACDKAARHTLDDIHFELPVEVVDLDTGKRWRAANVEVLWETGS